MEIVLGFLIAVAIGITGVGAGIITAPVLILFFHVPPAYAVGTALAFGVAVKLLVVPMQLARKQVNFRVLGYMLAGGLPGVIAGSLILARLNMPGRQGILYAALGSTIVLIAALNLYRVWLRPDQKPVRGSLAMAAPYRAPDRRGSGLLIGGRGRAGFAGAAGDHSSDGGASGGYRPVFRSLRIVGRQRIPVDCGQLRRRPS